MTESGLPLTEHRGLVHVGRNTFIERPGQSLTQPTLSIIQFQEVQMYAHRSL